MCSTPDATTRVCSMSTYSTTSPESWRTTPCCTTLSFTGGSSTETRRALERSPGMPGLNRPRLSSRHVSLIRVRPTSPPSPAKGAPVTTMSTTTRRIARLAKIRLWAIRPSKVMAESREADLRSDAGWEYAQDGWFAGSMHADATKISPVDCS
ncbi:hypothetical protein BDZ85DRAFT_262167 [Elsinoe ampelina]|uniref:Uncharacterized protein n=1 Tax=Elsinoe ampelina TaxID=302913 RepID=A0A6A6GDH7_9PEZI|nr:hypothetical protein BDZ85DRAFT_262167 [Elsinoe ampelina]